MLDLKDKRIILSGGGTAGHVFPLLAVAEKLKAAGAELVYFGSAGIERRLTAKKLTYRWVPSGKLRRYVSLATLWDALKLAIGILIALIRMLCFRPDLVLIKGGYVSLPALVAAKILDVKIVNHESDIVLGLANQLAHRWAEKSCFGFELNYYRQIDLKKAVFTGTPGRPHFVRRLHSKNYRLFNFQKNLPVLLVIGGSQGARSINRLIKPKLADYLKISQLIHMTGRSDRRIYERLKKRLPQGLSQRYFVADFLSDDYLTGAYALADVVVARAGASTLVDISLAKKAAILIPLPWAAGNHQALNARFYQEEEAIIQLLQKGLTADRLFYEVKKLLRNPEKRRLLSRRIERLAQPRAADKIVQVIKQVLVSQSAEKRFKSKLRR